MLTKNYAQQTFALNAYHGTQKKLNFKILPTRPFFQCKLWRTSYFAFWASHSTQDNEKIPTRGRINWMRYFSVCLSVWLPCDRLIHFHNSSVLFALSLSLPPLSLTPTHKKSPSHAHLFSLSLMHNLSYTHTHTHIISHTHTHILSFSFTYSHWFLLFQLLSHSFSTSHIYSTSLRFSLILFLILSLSLSFILTLSGSLSLFLRFLPHTFSLSNPKTF